MPTCPKCGSLNVFRNLEFPPRVSYDNCADCGWRSDQPEDAKPVEATPQEQERDGGPNCPGCHHGFRYHSHEEGCAFGWRYDDRGFARIEGCECRLAHADHSPIRLEDADENFQADFPEVPDE